MAYEELEIIIDVIGDAERKLDQLIGKLLELETAVQATDDINIDVDVDDSQLDTLLAKMSAANIGGATSIDVGGRGGMGIPDRDRNISIGDTDLDLGEMLTRQMGGVLQRLDNIDTSGMTNAMSAADKAADQFELSNLRMSDMHNAMAKMVPLLLVVVGSLPALITGFVALAGAALAAAAALSALTVFGALGAAFARGDGNIGEGFQDMLSEVRENFMDAFMPLMEDLAPTFERGLDGLETLFDAIANRGDTLLALRDDARAFGAVVLDVVPEALGNIARLADAAGPLLGEVVNMMEGMSLSEGIANVLAKSAPALKEFTEEMIRLAPHIFEISLGFLHVMNTLLGLTNAFLDLITLGGMLNEQLGLVIATALTLGTVFLLVNSAIWSFLALVGQRMILAIAKGIASLGGYTASSVAATIATWGLTEAVAALLAVATLGGALVAISAALGSVATMGFQASNGLDEATNSLRAFRQEQNRFGSGDAYAPEPATLRSRLARSGGSGGGVNVTVEGEGDADRIGREVRNVQFRQNRQAQ